MTATKTPAEIAAALTPAQVRALREPNKCTRQEWGDLVAAERTWGAMTEMDFGVWHRTPFGRAILAAVNKVQQ